MAWENPVTTWGQAGQTVPGVDDFNRIEGNINELNEEKALANHTHGNITSDGKIGSTANLPVFTGTNGVLGTKFATDALKALNVANIFGGATVYTELIPDNADFNSYTAVGVYRSTSGSTMATLSNRPTGVTGAFYLRVFHGVYSTTIRQEIIMENSPDKYERYWNGSAWTEWRTFFNSGKAVPIANGGTGATTAANARVALGLGSVATENTLPVSKGGTGATTAAQALNNLGLKFFRHTEVLDMYQGGVAVYTGLPDTYRYISHSIINSPVYPVKSISGNNFVSVLLNQSVAVDNTAIDIVIAAFQINVT
jgi:hypothetical protein